MKPALSADDMAYLKGFAGVAIPKLAAIIDKLQHPNSPQQPPADTVGGAEPPHAAPPTTDDDPLLEALVIILADIRANRDRLMTDRLKAAFIRDKLVDDFQIFPVMEGLGQ